MPRIPSRLAVLAAVVTLAVAVGASAPPPPQLPGPDLPQLTDGAPSVEALLERFLAALAARDRDALDRLRVTETEYRTFIMPGNVAPGDAPRYLPDDTAAFFWSLLDTKSRYAELGLLDQLGGAHYRLTDHQFLKGTRQRAWYTVRGQLLLTLEDESGERHEVRTGSIAEMNGTCKFVSFVRD